MKPKLNCYTVGDKETFWMAFDLIRAPYAFVPSYGGTVGYRNPTVNTTKGWTGEEICGGLFHTDEYLQPLWWNGGVLVNKHASRDQGYIDFQYYAMDIHGEGVRWIWETDTTPFCLMPSQPSKEIKELSTEHKRVTKEFVRMFDEMLVSEQGRRKKEELDEVEKELVERERLEKEAKKEKERLEKEKLARERLEREKAEKDKIEKEKLAQVKLEGEVKGDTKKGDVGGAPQPLVPPPPARLK
jgi:hypothetical protein